MSQLIIESSAVMRALIEDDESILALLTDDNADLVLSELTLVESYRTTARALREGRISTSQAGEVRRFLDKLEVGHRVIPATGEVTIRARTDLPIEPVRSTDAIHLVTALIWNERVGPTPLVSVDRRIRENAMAAGIEVLPEEARTPG